MGNVKAPDEIQQEFIDGFVAAGDTFEQFDYLLQLSAQLEELPEERKVKEVLVEGCQSQVWLYPSWAGVAPGEGFALEGDSDTLMVRGVIYLFSKCSRGKMHGRLSSAPCVSWKRPSSSIFSTRSGRRAFPQSRRLSRILRARRFPIRRNLIMASTMTLKDRLDIAAKDAEAAQEKITSGTLGREAFRQEVRNYTLAKFFLTEDEVRALGTEDILKLADESVEKLLRQNDKSVKLAEGSTTCTNQSSTDIKKVLLSLTLQRALNVRFTPEQSAELETITQLADALFDAKDDPSMRRDA